MPSAVCDGPAWSVCNRETERRSGDSGLDKDNVRKLILGTNQREFQGLWGHLAEFCLRTHGHLAGRGSAFIALQLHKDIEPMAIFKISRQKDAQI